MTMQSDLASRSKDIHWPAGFDPSQADLFSHNTLVIHADCQTVWRHIVSAETWPEWFPNSRDVRIISGAQSAALQLGAVFQWETFGLSIESRVTEFVPYTRLGWYGYSPGSEPAFYHAWLLEPTGDECRITTDEVGIGSDAIKFRDGDETLLHRGHDLWLATLKWVSENKTPTP